MFSSLSSSNEGFQSFQPVINSDGTHLYGKYRGKVLVAVGLMLTISYSHLRPLLWKARTTTIGVGSCRVLGLG